jgi:hypothetical protein
LVVRRLTRADVELLRTCCVPFATPKRAVALFPERVQVYRYNDTQTAAYAQSQETWISYPSTITVRSGPQAGRVLEWTTELRKALNVTPDVRVRIGTPCMYQHNVNPKKQIYNGARCTVVGFTAPTSSCSVLGGTRRGASSSHAHGGRFPVLYFPPAVDSPDVDKSTRTYVQYYIKRIRYVSLNGVNTEVEVEYLPFDICYAMTISKSQGLTLEAIRMVVDRSMNDLESMHVALSRVRSLQDIHILEFDERVLYKWMQR